MKNLTKKEEKIFNWIAYLLLFGVVVNGVFRYIEFGEWQDILWYCGVAAVVLAIGLIKKNPALVSSVVFTTIAAQFLWAIDFFLTMFGYGLGRTNFLVSDGGIILWLAVLAHLLIMPFSIYATYKFGFSKKSYWYAFFIFYITLLPLTYYFSSYSSNINCVFYPCDIKYAAYTNFELIKQNSNYFSIDYLLKYMGTWLIYCTLVYFMFRLIFKKLKRIVD